MKIDYAARARAIVGTRFRPQGRLPGFGLDCVGLVVCAFGLPVEAIRSDYKLRGDYGREITAELSKRFRLISKKQRRAGDVLLFRIAADQFHLGVMTSDGFVHADLRRGKVVETPGAPPWPLLAVFRRRIRGQS